MSLSKNIIDELKNQGSIPNVYQEHLIKVFDNIQLNIGLIDEIVNFFKKRSLGIYIWGWEVRAYWPKNFCNIVQHRHTINIYSSY